MIRLLEQQVIHGILPEIQTLEFVNSIWLFQNTVVPLHSMMSHETGGDSKSGALSGNLWQNIELRTVSKSSLALPLVRARTPKFLNPLHRLYIKKSCNFFQSYGNCRNQQIFFLLSFNTAKLRLPEVRSSIYIEFHRVIGPKLTLYAVKMLINFTLCQVHSFLCLTYETIACSLGNFCYLGRPQISFFFYGHAKIINFHQCI